MGLGGLPFPGVQVPLGEGGCVVVIQVVVHGDVLAPVEVPRGRIRA
jgi:hypothetical protein